MEYRLDRNGRWVPKGGEGATIELKFPIPEYETEAKHAIKGVDYYIALCDIEEYLRRIYKWQDEDWIDDVRDQFYEILGARGVFLD